AGQEQSFMLQVPANSSKVKVTLTWTDPIAVANAAKALVHDLDAELKLSTSGETWLPWVLNSAPHIDSLGSAPKRQRDTLNNVEQISIDNPVAGDYLIVIKGSEVSGKQHYAVAYHIEEANQFHWTYPVRSNPILNDKATVLRWEANLPGSGSIEYSINGGGWMPAGNVDVSQNYFRWIPPADEGEIIFRMTAGSQTILSDTIVLTSPINLKVGFNCPDSFLLYWNPAGLNGYQLYKLGEKYMEAFALSSDTIEILKKSTHSSLHYAVAPLHNGQAGFRSYTINYTTQAVECYIRSFLAELQSNTGVLRLSLGSIYNIASIRFQKLTSSGYNTLTTIIPGSTSLTYIDSFLTQGVNSYKVMIVLNNGQELFTSTEHIYYLPGDPVIVFPNPARQHEPIRIATSDLFVYSIFVYDASGKLVYSQSLDNMIQEIQPFRLSKGIYFVRMLGEGGRSFTRKLVVQ
ncbi:MAG TPA: T9SS type A sorting domain-containing protein, partial [Chitinophagaceae bacterium]